MKACVFFLMSTLSLAAMAHDGTVNITGSIYASSCDVDSNSQTKNIRIGDFAANSFSSVGDVQGNALLSITLNNCTAEIAGGAITFSGDADTDNTTLLALSDTSGGGNMASGVGVEVLDKDGGQIPLNSQSKPFALSEGDNTLTFYLRYMATKIPVTAGNASSVMYFDLSYQ